MLLLWYIYLEFYKQELMEALWYTQRFEQGWQHLRMNIDLVMAGRRNLYPVVVDWCLFAVFFSGGINVAVASQ